MQSKKPKQYAYPSQFTPTIALPIIARAYAYWVRSGRKPIEPDFFEKVMAANINYEAHLFWFDDVIAWMKTKK